MTVLSSIVGIVTAPFFKTIENVIHDLTTKQISEIEARTEIERIKADMAAKLESEVTAQYESWQTTLRGSILLQKLTAAVCITQLMVLLFYQLGVPAILFVAGWQFPTPDVQLEWAYALIAGAIGLYGIIRR